MQYIDKGYILKLTPDLSSIALLTKGACIAPLTNGAYMLYDKHQQLMSWIVIQVLAFQNPV